MRILMLSQFYPPIVGGEESVVHHTSQALARRGHDVAVATFHHGDLPMVERDGDVTVHRIRPTVGRLAALYGDDVRRHAPPGPDPETVRGLHEVLALHRPEIVHGHNWLVHSFLPLKRSSGAALVVTLHDHSLVCATKRLMHLGQPCSGPGPFKCLGCSAQYYGRIQGPLVAAGRTAATPFLKRATDLFLPVSRYVATRSRLADGSTPYEVVPNFLPDSFVRDRPLNSSLERLPRAPFILFAGDLSHDKGVSVLLEAHARMRASMELILVGRPTNLDLGTPAGVRILPPFPREVMPQAWNRSSIAVVPSLVHETFGLVALEALTSGRATIVSSAGNLPDLVSDGETGLIVPPGNVPELARALDRLASDDALRARLGAAAARAAAAYAEGVVVPRIEDLYRRVRARGAPVR